MANHDLDALLAEVGAKGETVTLFGKTWTLPTDVDAETMLRVQRLQMKVALAKRNGVEISEDDVIDNDVSVDELVRRMAGEANFAAWAAEKWVGPDGEENVGLGYRGMTAVAGRLYAIHSGGGEARGKGPKSGPGSRTRKSTASARSTARRTT